ncbi:MAG: hypothetical protein CMP40_03510 [Rickettsiales bacterium]|nr:hypothetical protein [Rickettsiales bacterium]
MEYLKKNIIRRKTRRIKVGNVYIGSNDPITVQSMTNTKTSDIDSTLFQIKELVDAGADLVRVSCPDEASTVALKEIISEIDTPIIADIHFHYKRAIEAAEAGASCLRINPGNIGNKKKIKEVVDAAKLNDCSIRIGVNAGSLEKDLLKKYFYPTPPAMLESALRHIRILEDQKFYNTKISVKASNIDLAVSSYRLLASKTDYPLHLGITEAGSEFTGSIKSAIGLGILLHDVMNDQRKVIYDQRLELLTTEKVHDIFKSMVIETIQNITENNIIEKNDEPVNLEKLRLELKDISGLDIKNYKFENKEKLNSFVINSIFERLDEKINLIGSKNFFIIEKQLIVQVLDQQWKSHLLNLDQLRQGIGLRAYAQRDPLNEYKREAFTMFEEMLNSVRIISCRFILLIKFENKEEEDIKTKNSKSIRERLRSKK